MHSNEFKLRCSKAGLLLLLLTLSLLANSQATFEKIIGFESEEWGHSVIQTADSGYIICGYTDQFQFKYDDVYLIKTDGLGNIIWTNNYGSSALEQGYSVKPTSDGGYILAAERYSPMYETIRAYLIRTDNYGDTIWTRKFAGSGNANARCAIETSDGGYAFCGVNESIEGRSPYLVKLDEYGEIIWEKTFTGPLNEWSYDMEQTTDGGYIICGGSEVEQFYDDFLIIRTDESGETIWTRNFGEPGYDAAHSILKSDPDGNYYAGGESWNTKDTTRFDFFIVKLNDQGDAIWEKRYGGNGSDFFGSMEYDNNGGIIACGWTNNPGQGGYDLIMFRIDTDGTLLWSQTFGGTGYDMGYSVYPTFDNGFIMTGNTNSFGDGSDDIYLLKTDGDGLLTNIKDLNINQEAVYKIFPNPNQGYFSINLPVGYFEIQIFNMQGQLVFRKDMGSEDRNVNEKIDLKNLSDGIYITRITDGLEENYLQKLIKK